jgi:hypothetical protein
MRMMTGNRVLWTLSAAAIGVTVLAGVASADINNVTTEDAGNSGSVIVFPKVVWDGTRDTIIQIANTRNLLLKAHCFYINGVGGACNETDFDIFLTKQQPTQWTASGGRQSNSTDGFGQPGSGFDPGLVPPVPFGFQGELKCIQVNPDDDLPFRGNAMKGEATLRRRDGDVSEYNAITFRGNTDAGVQEGDADDLFLDLTQLNDGEYSACPDTLLFDHFAYGATDPALGGSSKNLSTCTPALCVGGTTPGAVCTIDSNCGRGGTCTSNCPVTTELTLVPCQEDIENQTVTPVTVQFFIKNEFEESFSASTTVNCFLNLPLNQIGPAGNNQFTAGALGTTTAYTRINPNPGSGGVIGVAEESRCTSPGASACNPNFLGDTNRIGSANAAFNLHTEGNRFDAATDGKGNPSTGATDHILISAP